MSSFFDLDINFEDEENPNLNVNAIPAEDLLKAIDSLPESLREVAMGVLYEKRTFSDVSQALAIRQSELVTRLHRAQLAIGMYLMQK